MRAPYDSETHVHDGGIYAQDRWTIERLTLNLGVRWDFYRTDFPEQTLGPTVYTPNRNVTFPAPTWRASTTSRRSSASPTTCSATAGRRCKASLKQVRRAADLRRHLRRRGEPGAAHGAVGQPLVERCQRQLHPGLRPAQPAANGECGQISNLAFGNPVPSTTYDPDILTGWGKRGYNWEGSVSVQQQLCANVSLDVGYFRRWYGNFLATDNRALAPADFNSVQRDRAGRRAPARRRRADGQRPVQRHASGFGQTNNLLTFADELRRRRSRTGRASTST